VAVGERHLEGRVMALWCRDCPVVKVGVRLTPKTFTMVYPYYEAPQFLDRQIAGWQLWPADLRAQVSAIVVDDGSPTPARLPAMLPFAISLYRIEVDVRWNWLAARNIGAHHAPDGWLLVTDMDHVVPVETAQALVSGAHHPAVVYAFSRREHTGERVTPHSASFVMTRTMFWRIGGYDETLSGHYGTDGEYRRRVAAVAPIHVLADDLVRHEYVEDASTTRYQRKQPEDAAVKRLIAKRRPGWTPKTLSFPYHEVRDVA
jgi:hypothetical protein